MKIYILTDEEFTVIEQNPTDESATQTTAQALAVAIQIAVDTRAANAGNPLQLLETKMAFITQMEQYPDTRELLISRGDPVDFMSGELAEDLAVNFYFSSHLQAAKITPPKAQRIIMETTCPVSGKLIEYGIKFKNDNNWYELLGLINHPNATQRIYDNLATTVLPEIEAIHHPESCKNDFENKLVQLKKTDHSKSLNSAAVQAWYKEHGRSWQKYAKKVETMLDANDSSPKLQKFIQKHLKLVKSIPPSISAALTTMDLTTLVALLEKNKRMQKNRERIRLDSIPEGNEEEASSNQIENLDKDQHQSCCHPLFRFFKRIVSSSKPVQVAPETNERITYRTGPRTQAWQ
jgi:hypothetical protein